MWKLSAGWSCWGIACQVRKLAEIEDWREMCPCDGRCQGFSDGWHSSKGKGNTERHARTRLVGIPLLVRVAGHFISLTGRERSGMRSLGEAFHRQRMNGRRDESEDHQDHPKLSNCPSHDPIFPYRVTIEKVPLRTQHHDCATKT